MRNRRVYEQNVQGIRCKGLVHCIILLTGVNRCKELDTLTGKHIKFAARLFLWCHGNLPRNKLLLKTSTNSFTILEGTLKWLP